MKRCSHCGETKPRSEFHRNRAQKDGLSSECKPCGRARQRTPKHRAQKLAWAKRNVAQETARKQRWAKSVAPPCADCGGPVSRKKWSRCGSCRRAAVVRKRQERMERFIALRVEGLTNREIAKREGVEAGVVNNVLSRAKKRHGLEVPPPPYRSRAAYRYHGKGNGTKFKEQMAA